MMTGGEVVSAARYQLGDPNGQRWTSLYDYVRMACQRVGQRRPDLLFREGGTIAVIPASVNAGTELPFGDEALEPLGFLVAGLALVEDSDDGRNLDRGTKFQAHALSLLTGE